MNRTIPFKPYTINMVGVNDAEINLYGEVVERHPTDWWTGEPIPGNFIALDDFLKDLEELNGKDNITVHINSVGGSLYAGLAIYNRLKALPGKVTTICDALAASAASIIFMAGDTRKMNAGSNLMIHEAAHLVWGYYQVKDHEADIKQLEAHNKTAVAVYAERTGKDPEDIKTQLRDETWLTGQEAVDAGYADEVIETEGEGVSMSISPDKRFVVSNGVAMYTGGMAMPAAVAVMTEEQAAEFITAKESVSPEMRDTNTKNEETGGKHMEIKNVEDLRTAFPELVSEIENAAKNSATAAGVESERSRIRGIEAIEAAIGDKEMVKDAKYGENPITAEQLAFKAMQAQAAIGNKVVEQMEKDTKASKAEEVVGAPTNTEEQTAEEKEAEIVNKIAGFRPKK